MVYLDLVPNTPQEISLMPSRIPSPAVSIAIAVVMVAVFGGNAQAGPPRVAQPEAGQATLAQPSLNEEPTDPTAGPETSSDPVVIDDLTTPESTTYAEPDGSFQSVIATTPVNYRDASGNWQAIDNSLVLSPGAAYAVQNAANDYVAKIPEDASATPVRFSTDTGWVTFKLQGADGDPSVDDTEATFGDIASADSITYQATGSGLKESINLSAAPVAQPNFTFRLDMSSGLTPQISADGGVAFATSDTAVVLTMPPAFMTDSAVPTSAYSEAVPYTLVHDAEGWKVTVTPALGWLQDSARVFPVVIDPTITSTASTTDGWMYSATPTVPNPGDRLRVGSDAGGHNRRALLAFDVSQIPSDDTVTNADLALYLDASGTSNVTMTNYTLRQPSKVFTSAATWNSPDGTSSNTWTGGSPSLTDYSTIPLNGSTSGYKHWTPTDLVQGWVSGSLANRGLVLKQATENVDSLLWFYSTHDADDTRWPKLIVNYDTPPPQASTVQVTPTTTDSSSTHAAPTLTSTVTDPDGGMVRAKFAVIDASGAQVFSATSPFVSSGNAATSTVTAGILEVGKTYRAKSLANDGAMDAASWSALIPFTVTEPPPYLVGSEGDVDPYGQYIDGDDDTGIVDDPADEDVDLPPPPPGAYSYTKEPSGQVDTFVSSPEALSGGTWWDGVCTNGEDKFTVVKDYTRPKDHPRMERSYARMYCGKKDRDSELPLSEGAFGIRHIRPYHKSQFAKLASWQGSTWGNWMHWAVGRTLRYPVVRTVQNEKRFCYEDQFYFTSPNGQSIQRWITVKLGKTGVRIMTVYPTKSPTCVGPSF